MAMKNPIREEEDFSFVLQWHLTAKCDQHCQHCYMSDSSTYLNEIKNELDLNTCFRIIDDFSEAIEQWGVSGRINFTGGDPLLKKEIFDIIAYTRKRNINVGILGNPNHLDFETASKLKELGVFRYQISIDGLEGTHDRLRRRKGAFRDAIRAVRILNEVGIPSVVMFTVSKENADQLIDVIRLVAEENVAIFDFARLTPIGSGKKLENQLMTPMEYRQLLFDVLEEYRRLKEHGYKTLFGRKENLWTLLYYELGLLKPLPNNRDLIYSGCTIGCNILTILSDGTVLACRRLPVPIGKVPNQNLRDIFIGSDELNRMRNIDLMQKCSKCSLKQFCRGCRAIAYAVNGDYLAEDPQCWKVSA